MQTRRTGTFAMSLIRGRPFDGLRGGDWTVLEGVVARIEDAVVGLAERLAVGHLESGCAREAARVARRALLVSPYDERLYRLLLRAADLDGHPGAVDSVMVELLGVLGDPLAARRGARSAAETWDFVHPQTSELYRRLARRPTPASRRAVARL